MVRAEPRRRAVRSLAQEDGRVAGVLGAQLLPRRRQRARDARRVPLSARDPAFAAGSSQRLSGENEASRASPVRRWSSASRTRWPARSYIGRSSAGSTSTACASGRGRFRPVRGARCRATSRDADGSPQTRGRVPSGRAALAEPLRARRRVPELALCGLAARLHAARVAQRLRGRRPQAELRGQRGGVHRRSRRADQARDEALAPASRRRARAPLVRLALVPPGHTRRTRRSASCRRR